MTLPMTTSPNPAVLCAGDRLTRDEFERRYAAMPGVKKAELLEGVVYMPSPVRYTQHGEPHGLLAGWLSGYCTATPGVAFAIDASFRLDLDNALQPDLMLRIEGARGRSRVDGDHYIGGAPELLVEVAASSTSYDLHQKRHVYRRAGVQEYLVLRAEEAAVDWFVLRRGVYEPLAATGAGTLASDVFPGLWLDVPALLRADRVALDAALRCGLATAEHAAFAASLRA
jgi:Uma2 family endonuclease